MTKLKPTLENHMSLLSLEMPIIYQNDRKQCQSKQHFNTDCIGIYFVSNYPKVFLSQETQAQQ